jgi:hypothetical protein
MIKDFVNKEGHHSKANILGKFTSWTLGDADQFLKMKRGPNIVLLNLSVAFMFLGVLRCSRQEQ